MIKKENRLRSGREVGKILSKGSVVKTESLTIRYLRSKGSDPVRLTVVVSKKIFLRANKRNLLKRRVREAFAQEIIAKHGILIVVFPRKSASEMPFAALQEEVRTCLEKAPYS